MKTSTILAGVAVAFIAMVAINAQRLRELAAKLGEDWTRLHPDLQDKLLRVVDDVNRDPRVVARNLKLALHDGWRDVADQLKAIKAGTSFVSHPLNGLHPWGLAADLVWLDALGRWTWLPDPKNPKNTAYRDPLWFVLGDVAERHGLKWGGRWQQFDGPHVELGGTHRAQHLRAQFGDDPDKLLAMIATSPRVVYA